MLPASGTALYCSRCWLPAVEGHASHKHRAAAGSTAHVQQQTMASVSRQTMAPIPQQAAADHVTCTKPSMNEACMLAHTWCCLPCTTPNQATQQHYTALHALQCGPCILHKRHAVWTARQPGPQRRCWARVNRKGKTCICRSAASNMLLAAVCWWQGTVPGTVDSTYSTIKQFRRPSSGILNACACRLPMRKAASHCWTCWQVLSMHHPLNVDRTAVHASHAARLPATLGHSWCEGSSRSACCSAEQQPHALIQSANTELNTAWHVHSWAVHS